MGYWVETDGANKVTATRRYSDDQHALAGLSKVQGEPPTGAKSFNGGTYNRKTKKVSGVPMPPPDRRTELKAKDPSTWTEQEKTEIRDLL